MTKYPALKPQLNLKIRYDEIRDLDYIHKLNDSEKEWLNEFMDGWVNANTKNKVLKNKTELNKRNNDRNSCIYSRNKARGNLVYLNDLSTQVGSKSDMDVLIHKIDQERKKR